MTAVLRPLTDRTAPTDALMVEVSCRQCGGQLRELNAGRTDGVRVTWVGKCCTCRREYALVLEMRALANVSTSNQFTKRVSA
ncbi:MAG TPA: hypothetical protein VFK52_00150 [Nocardioidaceae bacterium]|nr:hypothetical protein [Nocardioidaceae bacterium]